MPKDFYDDLLAEIDAEIKRLAGALFRANILRADVLREKENGNLPAPALKNKEK